MSKTFKSLTILIILLASITSVIHAQTDRRGDGNKPKYYGKSIKSADSDETYMARANDSTIVAVTYSDFVELEALLIAVAYMDKNSQIAYIKNLKRMTRTKTLVLDPANYGLIFTSGNEQLASLKKLAGILSKSPHQLDKLMGKQISTSLKKSSEDANRGTVLGIVIAGLGSIDKGKTTTSQFVKNGAYMGQYFAKMAEKYDKNSFMDWETIKVKIFNLPSPYKK